VSEPTDFLDDVLSGLARAQKAVPPRWFYDKVGSGLFEAITRLPEYYPTEAERRIFAARMPEIAAVTGRGRVLVEFGSGSSTKTPAVLLGTQASAYVPIDISGEFLRESTGALARDFPGIPMTPIEADFTHRLTLPPTHDGAARLGFFPGSTIGNFNVVEAVDLLRGMRASLGDGAMLLIGMDLRKPEQRLIPAYDDAQGVTARFNLNLLDRINAELGGTLDRTAFRHVVRWNSSLSRIEMHLEAGVDLDFTVAGHRFAMRAGETIHTENSYKFEPGQARLLLRAGGWLPQGEWRDDDGLFAVFAAAAIGAEGE